jgi:hypothetical protein
MAAPASISPLRTKAPELLPIGEDDIGDVANFIAAQSGKSAETVASHLRWFLLENPARLPEHPLGFALTLAGEFRGCILCAPQMFCRSRISFLMMGSSSFYVDEQYRGQGGRLFLQYSRLGRTWPLFGTSTNAESAALWKAAGAKPIPSSDGELLGILRWPPFAEEFAHRHSSSRLLSRVASSSASRLLQMAVRLKIDHELARSLQPLACAEQVAEMIANADSEKLTAVRDLAYIRWRYFAGRDTTLAAYAYRSDSAGRDIFVAVNQRPRGYRGQIKTLNVLDVYPQVSTEDWVQIVGALAARHSNSVDGIVLRNQEGESREEFRGLGFRWRGLDAPTGWLLDRSRLLPASEHYIVPADGDGLI